MPHLQQHYPRNGRSVQRSGTIVHGTEQGNGGETYFDLILSRVNERTM